jgi:hypothetical protein
MTVTDTTRSGTKIWVNSGDSHFLEPDDRWRASLPPRFAELVPRAEEDPGGKWETVELFPAPGAPPAGTAAPQSRTEQGAR